jgi:hypothetical protein
MGERATPEPLIDTDTRSATMNTIKTNRGLKVKTSVKAGGLTMINHNRSGLKVRGGVKAGGLSGTNHNRGGVKVRASVKAAR